MEKEGKRKLPHQFGRLRGDVAKDISRIFFGIFDLLAITFILFFKKIILSFTCQGRTLG
jgi:hypothetical protein